MSETNITPSFTKREPAIAGKEYIGWIAEVKPRLRKMQAKAVVQVNRAMLEFYWSLGRDLAVRKELSKYGDGVVTNTSLDLRAEFPNIKGLGVTNIWYMKRWFCFYNAPKLHQSGEESGNSRKLHQAGKVSIHAGEKHQTVGISEDGGFLPDEQFFSVPWRHHVEIIQHCKTVEEALFYVRKTAAEGWSRSELEGFLAERIYEAQGKAQTNFAVSLPGEQGKLAQEMLKDPYNFGFLSLGKEHSERELEDALMDNLTRFLLELGKGFAFVGRHMELKMPDGTSYFPDLVFYHTKMHCYVVVELSDFLSASQRTRPPSSGRFQT